MLIFSHVAGSSWKHFGDTRKVFSLIYKPDSLAEIDLELIEGRGQEKLITFYLKKKGELSHLRKLSLLSGN